ncbi:hypothetical protein FRUB_08800 [Fimbriiglobus ruber]|uniref:Uncharacterized protein n=1 Tax=Fimbriiglobus ruber TaxID=1908690 RepID=A0A225DJC2_9BACT|nr:hypothetical protein FRUB_08800 [Fimbriiglobus ruber]
MCGAVGRRAVRILGPDANEPARPGGCRGDGRGRTDPGPGTQSL